MRVESGEGIERVITTTASVPVPVTMWNPVKELKAHERYEVEAETRIVESGEGIESAPLRGDPPGLYKPRGIR